MDMTALALRGDLTATFQRLKLRPIFEVECWGMARLLKLLPSRVAVAECAGVCDCWYTVWRITDDVITLNPEDVDNPEKTITVTVRKPRDPIFYSSINVRVYQPEGNKKSLVAGDWRIQCSCQCGGGALVGEHFVRSVVFHACSHLHPPRSIAAIPLQLAQSGGDSLVSPTQVACQAGTRSLANIIHLAAASFALVPRLQAYNHWRRFTKNRLLKV